MTRTVVAAIRASGSAMAAMLALGISPARALPPCAGTYLVEMPPDLTVAPGAIKTSGKLDLTLQGRFTYTLTRGEHEETAAGRWRAGDDRVILTGDPLIAPAFVREADEALDDPVLRIDLDLPNGLSRQFFAVAVRLADGSIVGRTFGEAAFDLAISAANPPVSLRIDVPTLALSSPLFLLQSVEHGGGAKWVGGHRLVLRFAPNDLGKVAFADTALIERDGALMLPHAGGDVAFRRAGRCSAE